jgi:hypothetical protein
VRAAVGVAAIIYGAVHLAGSGQPTVGVTLVDVIAVLSGASLVVGFLTPVAGALVVLGAAGIVFSWLPSASPSPLEAGLITIFVGVVAAAVILLGPGSAVAGRSSVRPAGDHHSTRFVPQTPVQRAGQYLEPRSV